MKGKIVVLLAIIAFGSMGGCEVFEDQTYEEAPVSSNAVWIQVESGHFEMGSNMLTNASPVHLVHVPSFQMKKTEVTVSEYADCVNAGVCMEPVGDSGTCNWDTRAEHPNYPVNCIKWEQAAAFCEWFGGRLPSEAEWEYAAGSAGGGNEYPWGRESPSCLYAIMKDAKGIAGCGTKRTWPVCSKPDGNTVQGLCDMAGNVQEWTQDHHHLNYNGEPPTDGSAWEEPGVTYRVLRGAAYDGDQPFYFEVSSRGNSDPTIIRDSIGFRCAR